MAKRRFENKYEKCSYWGWLGYPLGWIDVMVMHPLWSSWQYIAMMQDINAYHDENCNMGWWGRSSWTTWPLCVSWRCNIFKTYVTLQHGMRLRGDMSHNGYGRGLHGLELGHASWGCLAEEMTLMSHNFVDENKSFGLDNVREVEDFFDSKLNFVNKSTINGRWLSMRRNT